MHADVTMLVPLNISGMLVTKATKLQAAIELVRSLVHMLVVCRGCAR